MVSSKCQYVIFEVNSRGQSGHIVVGDQMGSKCCSVIVVNMTHNFAVPWLLI